MRIFTNLTFLDWSSQGMAKSQIVPWNNLWADLSQGMANSQMEPWNNLWADLSQCMANSDGTLKQPLGWSKSGHG